MHTPALALHGGAGTITRSLMSPEKEKLYTAGLQEALDKGASILQKGGTSLDAVCETVIVLENNPLFNAGKGAVFSNKGTHEMDASLMRGDSLAAGAVARIEGVKNPILLARMVMERSEHVFLSGLDAVEFGKLHQIELADNDYFYNEFRYQQWQEIKETDSYQLDHTEKSEKKFGTVGAVALDVHGNLAAATSTGGMTNKRFGRIGDSPVIGSGTYANNATCAISCTGHGEYFLRAVVAYDISCLMEYGGYSLEEACRKVVNEKLVKMGGEGGLVAVDAAGNICLPFNSEGMYRAFWKAQGSSKVEIYK